LGENLRDGSVTNCYSTGAVVGIEQAGGLVAYNRGSILSCFWDIETSGQAESLGGTGLTTGAMQDSNTYRNAGWDCAEETANGTDDLWWVDEGQDYPRLWWELPEMTSTDEDAAAGIITPPIGITAPQL
jgi:hypothetical protein